MSVEAVKGSNSTALRGGGAAIRLENSLSSR